MDGLIPARLSIIYISLFLGWGEISKLSEPFTAILNSRGDNLTN